MSQGRNSSRLFDHYNFRLKSALNWCKAIISDFFFNGLGQYYKLTFFLNDSETLSWINNDRRWINNYICRWV